jgi:hypothetical protein
VDKPVQRVGEVRRARLRTAVGDTAVANIDADEHVASVLRLLADNAWYKSELRLFRDSVCRDEG